MVRKTLSSRLFEPLRAQPALIFSTNAGSTVLTDSTQDSPLSADLR